MRYQEWWFWKLEDEFIKAGYEVFVVGKDKVNKMTKIASKAEMFSPINAAIEFECVQIEEYMSLELRDDDILFLCDISFPGVFCNTLFHKRPKKMFAFCHATSLNIFDYFSKDSPIKFSIETAHAKLFDTVFVGSNYHKEKLGWDNTFVTYLPFHPFDSFSGIRTNFIVSASRPTPQKVDSELEKRVVKRFSKIIRKTTNSWEEYFRFLGNSKVLLITSYEDTFGYQIVDAIMNGCIPIAPNRCAYPELLQNEYLYNSDEELFNILDAALWGLLDVPKLKCKNEMNNFYNTIVDEMKKETYIGKSI